MRRMIPPDPAAPDRCPSTVEAEPSAGDIIVTIDGKCHRLASEEARALARALIAGALVADPRFDLAGLDFDDGVAGAL